MASSPQKRLTELERKATIQFLSHLLNTRFAGRQSSFIAYIRNCTADDFKISPGNVSSFLSGKNPETNTDDEQSADAPKSKNSARSSLGRSKLETILGVFKTNIHEVVREYQRQDWFCPHGNCTGGFAIVSASETPVLIPARYQGNFFAADDHYCIYCGHRLANCCSACGAHLQKRTQSFCHCGESLTGVVTELASLAGQELHDACKARNSRYERSPTPLPIELPSSQTTPDS